MQKNIYEILNYKLLDLIYKNPLTMRITELKRTLNGFGRLGVWFVQGT